MATSCRFFRHWLWRSWPRVCETRAHSKEVRNAHIYSSSPDHDGECTRTPDEWLKLRRNAATKKTLQLFRVHGKRTRRRRVERALDVLRLPSGALLLARMPGRALTGAQEDVQGVDDKVCQGAVWMGLQYLYRCKMCPTQPRSNARDEQVRCRERVSGARMQ